MKTFQEILDTIRANATSERDKGDLFERLIKNYFLTDKLYSDKLKCVWQWSEFPYRDQFGGKDLGIDLVCLDVDDNYWAVQCKCYKDTTPVDEKYVANFIAQSGRIFYDKSNQKKKFTHRYWVSSSEEKFGPNAKQTAINQDPRVIFLFKYELSIANVDWEKLYEGHKGEDARPAERNLRTYQIEAIEAAKRHFIDENNDRGTLIMACGTGKTFTSLKLIENLLNFEGFVLFLVPSIALLSQTARSWVNDSAKGHKLHWIAVCSDVSSSDAAHRAEKKDDENDGNTDDEGDGNDAPAGATTDPNEIARFVNTVKNKSGLKVIFSTYQSIRAVAKAQEIILKDNNNKYGVFDYILCDEAHRTSGIQLNENAQKKAKKENTDFIFVHDNKNIKAKKRLYMTATPRLYKKNTIEKAKKENIGLLLSMDNELVYGKYFYTYAFWRAVKEGYLSDYKVLVLTVSEKNLPEQLRQKICASSDYITSEDYKLKLKEFKYTHNRFENDVHQFLDYENTLKLYGSVSALSKLVKDDQSTWKTDPQPIKRAIIFADQIGSNIHAGSSYWIKDNFQFISEQFRDFGEVKPEELLEGQDIVTTITDHVDGSMDSKTRHDKLDWLKMEPQKNQCRVISNVRCLSEGVDVPTLDAAIFMCPRKSPVEIVQSVGRVMRIAPGKKLGYIIIPVFVPSTMTIEDALKSERFDVVWSVVNALRSHDETLWSQLATGEMPRITIGTPGGGGGNTGGGISGPIDIPWGEELAKIRAKLVEECGDRLYWTTQSKKMGEVAQNLQALIRTFISDPKHKDVQKDFDVFVEGLRRILNPTISREDAIVMLSQHTITKPIFDALFSDYNFENNNPISKAMSGMVSQLEKAGLEHETQKLDEFKLQIQNSFEQITEFSQQQSIIKDVYEKFFKLAFEKTQQKLGIVYTPIPCIDFIWRSVEQLTQKEFGFSLSDKRAYLLDPFAGTGTFFTRLLQSGIIKKEDMERKYQKEMRCHELQLLAYYVADVNIENVFHNLNPEKKYQFFNGICLTDTFALTKDKWRIVNGTIDPFKLDNAEKGEDADKAKSFFTDAPKDAIRIICCNPPYSVGQKSANDNAQNDNYPDLDERIKETYSKFTKSTLKRSLKDSYIKALRWSSDIVEQCKNGGIVVMITPNSLLTKDSLEGVRYCFENEFSDIYIVNLKGSGHEKGEALRSEGEPVFAANGGTGGSLSGVCIFFLVNNPKKEHKGKIHYYDIGYGLKRKEKFEKLDSVSSIFDFDLQEITPNEKHDWLNQRDSDFDSLTPLEGSKNGIDEHSVFKFKSLGVATSRDYWCVNFSNKELCQNIKKTINYYNKQVDNFKSKKIKCKESELLNYVDTDEKKISWSRGLRNLLLKNTKLSIEDSCIVNYYYRPFTKTNFLDYRPLVESYGTMPSLFPKGKGNKVICVSGKGRSDFSVMMTDSITCYDAIGATNAYPLYYYVKDDFGAKGLFASDESMQIYVANSAISRIFLKETREKYLNSATSEVTEEDIFYYVYGLLHSKSYVEKYAADLQKSLPRIATPDNYQEFIRISQLGKELSDLHLNYENQKPLDSLVIEGTEIGNFEVSDKKMKFDEEKRIFHFNDWIEIKNIPAEIDQWKINGYTALRWISESYYIKTDQKSGIVNNPNLWCEEHNDPKYIFNLVLSVITTAKKTVELVNKIDGE